MKVLGIETSCDETSVAIVENGKRILSNVVASSLRFHQKYGGIVPEIASRMQLETIAQVADACLKEAGIKLEDVGLISVTGGPGLLGSLLVGVSFGQAVSLSLKVPLLQVNHVHSHLYAAFLDNPGIPLPFVALVVSGGHTSLFYVRGFDRIELLGATQDDACGEAFDKVAKILGLGYPGGPFIERLGEKGDPRKIKFNCSQTKHPLNFSFSGIKTAVLYLVRAKKLAQKDKQDIAASFQEAAIRTLVNKTLLACKHKKASRLVVGGGVAANNRLRKIFYGQTKELGISCFFPARKLCMDNAAMVAGLGYRLCKKGKVVNAH